jgi:hypothetical protein
VLATGLAFEWIAGFWGAQAQDDVVFAVRERIQRQRASLANRNVAFDPFALALGKIAVQVLRENLGRQARVAAESGRCHAKAFIVSRSFAEGGKETT